MTHALAPLLAGAALLTGALSAQAADYPTKPIRIVVPYAAGGSTDVLARLIGERLGKLLGQPAVVDNRPGGSEQIAIVNVTKAAPDGYTLLLSTLSGLAVNPGLYGPRLPYDPLKDLAPVLLAATVPSVVVVHPQLPVKSMAELGAYLKANKGTVNYASAGNGTPSAARNRVPPSRGRLDFGCPGCRCICDDGGWCPRRCRSSRAASCARWLSRHPSGCPPTPTCLRSPRPAARTST